MNRKLQKMLSEANSTGLPSILMAAAECAPFAKTGGLADMVGALAAALKREGFDVRVVMPFHRTAKEKYLNETRHLTSFGADLGWRSQYAGVEMLEYQGVPFYFIDNEYYFGYEIYKGGNMEGEQYAFFSRAVLEALPLIGFVPDILHAHDWHTAMIPMLLKTQYSNKPQGGIRSVLTMHNLGYQGKFDFGFVSDLLGIDRRYYQPDYMEHYGAASFMKGGVVFADQLTTVSPTYAEEIRTPWFGEGLDGILTARSGDLAGIVNGIDTKEFNPKTDPMIAQKYDTGTIEDKQINKTAVLDELGLSAEDGTPLICMVTRLTEQKGLDLLTCVFDDLMAEDIRVAILGSGDAQYEDFLRCAQGRHPGKMAAALKYDNTLAHRLYAGSDFLLMPSRFEPCGISQLIAMRYGTLPIVRATGGLKDTVEPFNRDTGKGTGFTFDNYNAHDMLNTIRCALSVYRDQERLALLRKSAMRKDVSFKASALAYAALYIELAAADRE